MKFGKITIIGSGRVGTSTAFGLICQNIAKEVSLLDINEDVLEAECIDLRDAKYFSFTGHVHKGNWEDAKNSQIIVICAGEVLRPESSLHQVVNANKRIFDDIFSRLGQLHQKCVVIVATSPVDSMTQYAQKLSGLPKNQVFGTGTLLDTQRLRVKLGKKFQINEKSVHAYVMGEKGDTAFVPWSHATIAGRKLTEFFSEDPESQSRVLDTFVNKIKTKTDRILTSKYGTNFGIAACIAAICKDIIYDTNAVLPLSCWVNEFGCYMSVLCTLGENGISKTLPLDLTDKERYCFQNCSNSIWHSLKWLGFEREGYGAIGEKKGVEAPTTGLAPGGGLTETSVTGTSLDLGKGPEIGGGLGTDIGGFGKTSFEPLKESELATPTEFGTTLGKTDIRGIDLSKKTTELAGTTDLTEKSTDLGIGNVLSKPMDLDLGQPGGLGKEPSTIGGRRGTPGTTELGGAAETTGLGRDVGDITKTQGWDSSFGGGPTVTDTDKSKTDLSKSTTGLGTGLGTDISEGMKKDVGGEFGGEQKRLVSESAEKTVSETLGRPTRQ